MSRPLVSIVIPTFKRRAELLRLLGSLKQSAYSASALEVIVVDNAAEPDLADAVKAVMPTATVLVPGTNVFSHGARRRGADAAKGTYIFLVDDDNTLEADCIPRLVEALEQDDQLGAVAPLMLRGNTTTIWCAGGRLSGFGLPHYLHKDAALDSTSLPERIDNIDFFPNAWMIRAAALQHAAIDDETFPHNWAEADLCLQILAAGYTMATITSAIDHHHIDYDGSLTRLSVDRTYDQARSRLLFRRRYLSKAVDWLKFWLVIFPVSSVVYAWHIVRLPEDRVRVCGAYLRGTLDGLVARLSIPKVLKQTIKE